MKYLKLLTLLIATSLLSQSCDVDDCSKIACTTPPPSISFQLYENQMDVLAQTDFNLSQLKAYKLNTDNFLTIDTVQIEGDYFFRAEGLGWQESLNNYQFTYKGNDIFAVAVAVDLSQQTENCCSFYVINDMEVQANAVEEIQGNYFEYVYRVNLSVQ